LATARLRDFLGELGKLGKLRKLRELRELVLSKNWDDLFLEVP